MAEGIIIKALSGFYYVEDNQQIIQCRGRGIFRKNKITPLVGDHVVYQAENDKEGYIMEIKARKNELIRPPIANIDQAILTFSAKEPDFNPVLLDRFLVFIQYHQITPLICITKTDLLTGEEKKEIEERLSVYQKVGYEVIFLSAYSTDGFEQFRSFIANQTSVFAGQSGVGKTSLLNALQPGLELKTSKISSHLGRGRHTTRHVEFIRIGDGLIADTPGFSSLEFNEIDIEDLAWTFPEIRNKGKDCKFRGCFHENEPHCAVKAAVKAGDIDEQRYQHYIQFLTEIKDRKPRY
ncbi:ribosome small subunit-dependent GTPase A [Lederbergia sp. NSJ-179]|uniref:ribosome small subunit-dependent GTPase A n=1 Tax=Lederbergia sp. NSJ-179 TaxID=2931402 RepID=UPI001FD141CB|nr:ribosome small subunit-dependent GTPase A [Lederbergia sp. NSJ-179]MCJ7839597.1 ribosome small subunit-dependent GTPase A [Lederbergia sp. NSJ-179]